MIALAAATPIESSVMSPLAVMATLPPLPQSVVLQLALDAICPPAIRLTLWADTAIDPAAPDASLETTMPLGPCLVPPVIVSVPAVLIPTLPPAPLPVVVLAIWAPPEIEISAALIVTEPALPDPPAEAVM